MEVAQSLDACAMIAYLRGEPGGSIVQALLADPSTTCFAHAVNLCEVFYIQSREFDEATAREGIATLMADGVVERGDLDQEFWMRVASHKSRGRIALPDCFCIALAERLGGRVVTSDHKEFDPLISLALCPILFIR